MLLDITEDQLQKITDQIVTLLGGEDISVDISKKEVLLMLDMGAQEFNKETSIWQLKNQFANIYGMPAGQVFNNQLATFNMNIINQITDWFASMSRTGGKIPWKKGFVTLEPGRQIYDLSKESNVPYNYGDRRIHRVMWFAKPEAYYGQKFDGTMSNISGDDVLNASTFNFTNAGLNYGGQPLSFLGYAFDTIMMLQSMETRRKVLFSEFYHNLSGDFLELFPMPGGRNLGIDPGARVFYYYFNEADVRANAPTVGATLATNGIVVPGSEGVLIANPAYAPIQSVPWSMLSPWAQTWIWEYAMARCKYIQGSKLRKIKKNYSSGEMDYDIEFDYTSFLTEADADLNKLRDDLRSDLEKLNLVTLYQDKDSMAQAAKNINRLSARNWLVG